MMQPGERQQQQQDAARQLQAFMQHTLPPRGHDAVTAASDLWSHSRISPILRDAALNLHGSDIYKRVKPAGDTRLFIGEAWSIEKLIEDKPGVPAPPQEPARQLSNAEIMALAASLPPGRHTMDEAARGPPAPLPGR